MKNIIKFIKRIPVDVRQAIYSLSVSVLLITGALMMLGGYLEGFEEKPDTEVSATIPDEDEVDEDTSP
jgi:hypothetical protein